jgi:hypothetical protein
MIEVLYLTLSTPGAVAVLAQFIAGLAKAEAVLRRR